ncbi:hypothetical protein VW29_03375 [Devosia limi DSM 17137]|uniref:diguanylate cyclase n=1 Tax=Devosia limi DSM 17137 TaxID=1121477 RepID=A0A0F5LVU4_9HYPH|nr:GGDEF domain-containing protein [Devosia limi]KKB86237.1 hypothetical protein VW29_03070 [Devosia limi DSM 17137]KKB86289.1 hypothetical protein VW29_03375 [Devosia limi DSM 17137]SHF14719.1 diguanylate cyclase (GGDEF) domain-containing protein [Devosia limi DSM 17137]
MSAAAFVLAINLFVAAVFASAFGIIAAYERSSIGARWLAVAYGLGIINAGLEFILPFQQDARPVGIAIFATFLFALTFCIIGLSHHYRRSPPRLVLASIVIVALITVSLTIHWPRDNFLRALLYQFPYFALQLVAMWVVFHAPRRRSLDIVLLVLFAASAMHFLSKPFLAMLIGSGASPQAYLGSTYAAYSQTLAAFLLVANGLAMLLIIVRDVMGEMTARSETDQLSGMLNRRGFEDRTIKAMLHAHRTGSAAAMVVADLDFFKQVNDTYGHQTGDQVIVAFARTLQSSATPTMIAGRLGGEEFAVFVPDGSLAAARLFAETARAAVPEMHVAGLDNAHSVTASFGVAPLLPGDSLSDVMRRADAALYQAKRGGRNDVRVTQPSAAGLATLSGKPSPGRRRNGSRRD